jgi:hypothetical protein
LEEELAKELAGLLLLENVNKWWRRGSVDQRSETLNQELERGSSCHSAVAANREDMERAAVRAD